MVASKARASLMASRVCFFFPSDPVDPIFRIRSHIYTNFIVNYEFMIFTYFCWRIEN